MFKITLRTLVCVAALGLFIGCSDDPDADAPTLTLDVSAEETYSTADEIVIHMTATDPNDQDLEFETVEAPEAADFETYRNEALFKWAPNAGDITDDEPHRLVFAVTNEDGLTTERTVRIHIEGQQGTRFLNSSSQLFNPSSGEALRFAVEVEHPSEPQVVLSMPTAPDGAVFQQTDDFEGEFEWSPTPSQLDKRTHSVVLEADAGGEFTEQDVTIIIQSSGASSPDPDGGSEDEVCGGDEPIDHDRIEIGQGAGDYEITGEITDTSRDWQQAVLYWTFDDPLGEDPQFESAEMNMEGSTVSGKIPNPLLSPGDAAEVSYAFCVFDEQADEEGTICAPAEYYYRFPAYAPDDQECIDDGVALGDPESADSISAVAWEPYRTCEGAPNYHTLDIAEGESVEIALSFSGAVTPEIDLQHEDSSIDVEVLPCIGLAYAVIEQPGTAQLRVGGDHFPYHVTAFVDDPDVQECDYEHSTTETARLLVDDFAFFEDEICASDDWDLYTMELLPGDLFEGLMAFSHADGDLDLTLYGPGQADQIGDGAEPVAQAWSEDDDEYLDYTVEEAGFHYLLVDTVDEPNDYELTTGRMCGDVDQFSDNHALEDAAAIDLQTYHGLKLCAGDSDWFEYVNDGESDVDVDGAIALVAGDDPGTEIGMYQSDGSEWPVDRGIVDNDNGAFYGTVEPGESLFVEIGSEGPYYYELHLEESSF